MVISSVETTVPLGGVAGVTPNVTLSAIADYL